MIESKCNMDTQAPERICEASNAREGIDGLERGGEWSVGAYGSPRLVGANVEETKSAGLTRSKGRARRNVWMFWQRFLAMAKQHV